MSETPTLAPSSPAPETVAERVIEALVDVFGCDCVRELVAGAVGGAPGVLVGGAMLVAADVVRALVARVGQAQVEAALEAQFAAVDVAVDALEDEKFPRGTE